MLLYIGTYTTKGSRGIYRCRFDTQSGALAEPALAAETESPSCLALHPTKRFLYAVNELREFGGLPVGAVTAFRIDRPSGDLARLNQRPAAGLEPCHLVTDGSGKYLLVAHFGTGAVEVFALGLEGLVGESVSLIQHHGAGPHWRQEGPHAHGVYLSADNRRAYVPDLGLDAVMVYRFAAETGALDPRALARISLRPGAGPRRLAFHPAGRFVYLLNELDSTITALTLDRETGIPKEVQTLSALPESFNGANTAAEIEVHPNGKFLYVSNRGYHGLGVFAIEARTGRLAPIQHVPAQGLEPRHFALDPAGKWLVVANQNTNGLSVFRVDGSTGSIEPCASSVDVPTPTWVQWV